MPGHEFLQTVVYHLIPGGNTDDNIRDIQMPKCGPSQMCNIWGIRTTWNQSATDIRWRLWFSLEPKDVFRLVDVDDSYMNDVFHNVIVFRTIDSASGVSEGPNEDTVIFPLPFAYPYDKLRVMSDATSAGAGAQWVITIYYTIEVITRAQLTAITVRRGTTRHAREGGPEGT